MKQYKEWLFVDEVHPDSVAFEIFDKESHALAVIEYRRETDFDKMFTPGRPEPIYPLPNAKWEILGRAKDLTEEQWKEIVSHEELERGGGYEDYGGKFVEAGSEYYLRTATESGYSLLKSLSLDENCLVLKRVK